MGRGVRAAVRDLRLRGRARLRRLRPVGGTGGGRRCQKLVDQVVRLCAGRGVERGALLRICGCRTGGRRPDRAAGREGDLGQRHRIDGGAQRAARSGCGRVSLRRGAVHRGGTALAHRSAPPGSGRSLLRDEMRPSALPGRRSSDRQAGRRPRRAPAPWGPSGPGGCSRSARWPARSGRDRPHPPGAARRRWAAHRADRRGRSGDRAPPMLAPARAGSWLRRTARPPRRVEPPPAPAASRAGAPWPGGAGQKGRCRRPRHAGPASFPIRRRVRRPTGEPQAVPAGCRWREAAPSWSGRWSADGPAPAPVSVPGAGLVRAPGDRVARSRDTAALPAPDCKRMTAPRCMAARGTRAVVGAVSGRAADRS